MYDGKNDDKDFKLSNCCPTKLQFVRFSKNNSMYVTHKSGVSRLLIKVLLKRHKMKTLQTQFTT